MIITLPSDVKRIIEVLETAGYEAYAVGGCVRDSILGRVPDDWDITTSAKPHEVKMLFKRTFDTGIEHGTVTVLMNKVGYEVTTYRIDGEYEDSRHPREVTFTSDLIEDLKRRDFTINAMAYNDNQGLIDCFGGLEDIQNHLIRCVGNPEERFSEDALRIMRAVRFSAQLGYDIEEETKNAICKLAGTLSNISAERIQTELVKLLVSPNPGKVRQLYEYGITKVILPEFDAMMNTPQNTPYHIYNVGDHTICSLENIEADKVLRLTMLLHDCAKPLTRSTDEEGRDHFKYHAKEGSELAKTILRRLRFDNDTIKQVTTLILYHQFKVELTEIKVRMGMHKVGEDLYPKLLLVKRADNLSKAPETVAKSLQLLEEFEQIYKCVRDRGDCTSLKKLAVTGKDLIEAGIEPGEKLGQTLEFLLQEVLLDPDKNEKEVLLSLI